MAYRVNQDKGLGSTWGWEKKLLQLGNRIGKGLILLWRQCARSWLEWEETVNHQTNQGCLGGTLCHVQKLSQSREEPTQEADTDSTNISFWDKTYCSFPPLPAELKKVPEQQLLVAKSKLPSLLLWEHNTQWSKQSCSVALRAIKPNFLLGLGQILFCLNSVLCRVDELWIGCLHGHLYDMKEDSFGCFWQQGQTELTSSSTLCRAVLCCLVSSELL